MPTVAWTHTPTTIQIPIATGTPTGSHPQSYKFASTRPDTSSTVKLCTEVVFMCVCDSICKWVWVIVKLTPPRRASVVCKRTVAVNHPLQEGGALPPSNWHSNAAPDGGRAGAALPGGGRGQERDHQWGENESPAAGKDQQYAYLDTIVGNTEQPLSRCLVIIVGNTERLV